MILSELFGICRKDGLTADDLDPGPRLKRICARFGIYPAAMLPTTCTSEGSSYGLAWPSTTTSATWWQRPAPCTLSVQASWTTRSGTSVGAGVMLATLTELRAHWWQSVHGSSNEVTASEESERLDVRSQRRRRPTIVDSSLTY